MINSHQVNIKSRRRAYKPNKRQNIKAECCFSDHNEAKSVTQKPNRFHLQTWSFMNRLNGTCRLFFKDIYVMLKNRDHFPHNVVFKSLLSIFFSVTWSQKQKLEGNKHEFSQCCFVFLSVINTCEKTHTCSQMWSFAAAHLQHTNTEITEWGGGGGSPQRCLHWPQCVFDRVRAAVSLHCTLICGFHCSFSEMSSNLPDSNMMEKLPVWWRWASPRAP